jgi:hypothetical protein
VNNDYLNKFYELGYTHLELEALLKKIADGEMLTKEQYETIIKTINSITNLDFFDGSYDSLTNKPDIVDVIKKSNEFITYEAFDYRSKTIFVNLQLQLKDLIEEALEIVSGTKADIDHKHDDRYSLINHTHEGIYVEQKDYNNQLQNLVTKDYLDSVIAGLGPGSGGGGGVYPTYVKPTISAKASSAIVAHKQATSVTVTPTYQKNDAGELIKFQIIKDKETVYEGTEVKAWVDNVTLKHGETITYTFVAQYGDGIIKDTVTGEPYPDTMIKAGTVTAGITIKAVADSYYGVIADKEFIVEDITSLSSIRNTSKGYTYTFDIDEQKSVYIYPESFGLLNSIKDANNFEYKNSYTHSIIEYNDVKYNVYVLTDAVTVPGGFKQVFS